MTDNITKLLLQLGIRSTYYGFRYLRYALELCLKVERYLTSVYKTLYSEIAAKFETSCYNVEHCIRTVISYCWDRGNRDFLISIAGYQLSEKPTNSEFIDILYHYLET